MENKIPFRTRKSKKYFFNEKGELLDISTLLECTEQDLEDFTKTQSLIEKADRMIKHSTNSFLKNQLFKCQLILSNKTFYYNYLKLKNPNFIIPVKEEETSKKEPQNQEEKIQNQLLFNNTGELLDIPTLLGCTEQDLEDSTKIQYLIEKAKEYEKKTSEPVLKYQLFKCILILSNPTSYYDYLKLKNPDFIIQPKSQQNTPKAEPQKQKELQIPSFMYESSKMRKYSYLLTKSKILKRKIEKSNFFSLQRLMYNKEYKEILKNIEQLEIILGLNEEETNLRHF